MDIKKLMSQLERSETARSETEKKLSETRKNLDELKEASDKHNSIKEKLQVRKRNYTTPSSSMSHFVLTFQSEVKDLKKRLRTAEDDYKTSEVNTARYLSTLKDVYHKIGPHIAKAEAKKEEGEEKEGATVNGGTPVKTEEGKDSVKKE